MSELIIVIDGNKMTPSVNVLGSINVELNPYQTFNHYVETLYNGKCKVNSFSVTVQSNHCVMLELDAEISHIYLKDYKIACDDFDAKFIEFIGNEVIELDILNRIKRITPSNFDSFIYDKVRKDNTKIYNRIVRVLVSCDSFIHLTLCKL